jgi:hypothetical protein
LQVAVVADEHDGVSRGDAQRGNEADQRAQRDDAAREQPTGDAAQQRERQQQEHQRHHSPGLEVDIQDQQDCDHGRRRQSEHSPAGNMSSGYAPRTAACLQAVLAWTASRATACSQASNGTGHGRRIELRCLRLTRPRKIAYDRSPSERAACEVC